MIHFFKGHGLGNDFLILEGEGLSALLSVEFVRALCDRRQGLGADGILIREEDEQGLPFMRIYNADGTEPEMCGNGLRVFGLYLVEKLGAPSTGLEIGTPAGIRRVDIGSRPAPGVAEIRVEMGQARDIQSDGREEGRELVLDFQLGEKNLEARGQAISMGNPHFVVTDDRFSASWEQAGEVGPILEKHPRFPEGANIEFMTAKGPESLEVVVWERGCGLTRACGTGACAATVVAARIGLVPNDREIKVCLPGGELKVRVESGEEKVWMTGPASLVAQGILEEGWQI